MVHGAVCPSSSVNSTECVEPRAALWSCCGLGGYHHIAPAALWLVFLSLTACAQYHYNLFHDLDSTADELHDIQTQALGVVVARRKRVIFGKSYRDPRRLLMLGAMWSELFGFSYTPGQLVIYQLTQSNIAGLVSGPVQFGLFAVFSGLLYLLEGPRWLRKCHLRRPKLGGPILYDMFFMTFAYTLVNVVGCTNGLDSVALGDNVTCASPERYWMVCSLGLVVFGCFFWGTLKYKKQLASDVYAVSFRFQASFDAMMTCTRTICALTVITVEKALLVLDMWLVAVLFGLLNLVHFGALLRYNYKCQPCLGVGLVPNNLRALSFATSCYTTLVSLVISMLQIARHPAEAGTAEWTVFFVAIGLYPAVAVTVWRWNRRRAVLFQVPNLSLLDALQHESDRVRAIAAVTVTLETAERDADTLQAILLALNDTLWPPEAVFAPAYACQAMWFLWYSNFDLVDHVSETGASAFVPFGCWVRLSPARTCAGGTISSAFRISLSQVLAGRSASGRLSISNSSLVAPVDLSRRSRNRPSPVDSSSLVQLVEKATDLEHTVCMTNRIADNPAIRSCFEHAVKKLAELCKCNCRRNRLLASKVLQEMYQASVVRVSATTFLHMAANLTIAPSHAKAMSALRTLVRFVNDRDEIWAARQVANVVTLRLLIDALLVHVGDIDFVTTLLTFLIDRLETLLSLGTNAPSGEAYLDRSMVSTLHELFVDVPSGATQALIDDLLMTMQDVWNTRPYRPPGVMRQLSKTRIMRQLSKTHVLPTAMTRLSESSQALLSFSQLKVIKDRQRARMDAWAAVNAVLAEGFSMQLPLAALAPPTQLIVASLLELLSTRSDLLSYLESRMTMPEYWYLSDLVGKSRPRIAIESTHCAEST
ncbi:hypothetical protein SPRG_13656 [Saprolegnia parasitica CBS 223.65]|uniref:Uncharacterized protein n=1 Tax=Saprolegnia parasitica (strain CBS 223.65) TaxID=695850 RepID=A0A067BS58_SAPPC|nr:hypothetical protein SPRG_13656 [Saprolegnia parasitica CBS 223.65]KDO21339.1 hypothetical protein SPRG_13656 [Saprolegnia parasitica CBS 223.65]|eukprot:XP_012207899.1 hypothetical protein SPRG_13656 [Saprolegnia parasitica CBS 223.65]